MQDVHRLGVHPVHLQGALGGAHHLLHEAGHPRGGLGKADLPGLPPVGRRLRPLGLGRRAGVVADEGGASKAAALAKELDGGLEVSDQGGPVRLVLDDDHVGLPLHDAVEHGLAEVGILHALGEDLVQLVEEVPSGPARAPGLDAGVGAAERLLEVRVTDQGHGAIGHRGALRVVVVAVGEVRALEERAIGRRGSALVQRPPPPLVDVQALLRQRLLVEQGWRQGLALRSPPHDARARDDRPAHLVVQGQGGQVDVEPAVGLPLHEAPDLVVLVPSGHQQDHGVARAVGPHPAHERRLEPAVALVANDLAVRLLVVLQKVVADRQVGTFTGDRSSSADSDEPSAVAGLPVPLAVVTPWRLAELRPVGRDLPSDGPRGAAVPLGALVRVGGEHHRVHQATAGRSSVVPRSEPLGDLGRLPVLGRSVDAHPDVAAGEHLVGHPLEDLGQGLVELRPLVAGVRPLDEGLEVVLGVLGQVRHLRDLPTSLPVREIVGQGLQLLDGEVFKMHLARPMQ